MPKTNVVIWISLSSHFKTFLEAKDSITSIARCKFSRQPMAMPINANQASNNKVTSSDQKKTKLNIFRVMTCTETMRTIVSMLSRQKDSTNESTANKAFFQPVKIEAPFSFFSDTVRDLTNLNEPTIVFYTNTP